MMGLQGIPLPIKIIIEKNLKRATNERKMTWWSKKTPEWISQACIEINEMLLPLGHEIKDSNLLKKLHAIETDARKGTGRGTPYMEELVEETSIQLADMMESLEVTAAAA